MGRLGVRLLFVIGVAFAATHCAVVDNVDGRFLQTNLSTEKASYEATLLNIVRASQNAPLNFVGVSQINGSTTASIGGGAPTFLVGPYPIPASTAASGTRDATVNATTLSGAANASNSYVLTVLGSKDFYTALLSPIDLVEVNFFLRQGYSNELMFWLFVDSVREQWPGHSAIEYLNSPHLPPTNVPGDGTRTFRNVVEIAMMTGLTIETRTVEAGESKGGGGEGGGGKSKGGSSSSGSSGGAKAPATEIFARVCFDPVLAARTKRDYPAIAAAYSTQGLSNLKLSPLCYTKWDPKKTVGVNSGAENDTLSFTITDPVMGTSTWQIFTRSTYGVYQYLGQILASGKADQLLLHRAPGEPDEYPVLAITRNTHFGRCFAELNYNSDYYCVPDDRAEHTKRIFSLLTQLLGLKTQTSDLAITPLVRITP